MPIYEYVPDNGECQRCQGRFEALQRLNEGHLQQCPHCGQSVHRVLSRFAPQASEQDQLAPKNLEQHGFTQYRRSGKGHYEKTAGHGPSSIHDDGKLLS